MSQPKAIDADITAVVNEWASAIGTENHAKASDVLDAYLVDLTNCRNLRDRLLYSATHEIEVSYNEGRGDEALRRLAPLYPEFANALREFYADVVESGASHAL